jgi:hypothetical protein
MTFYALATYPPPTLSISQQGSTNVLISFQSVSNKIYSLHSTNSAGLTSPVTSWPTAAPSITGDGTVKVFTLPIQPGQDAFFSVGMH